MQPDPCAIASAFLFATTESISLKQTRKCPHENKELLNVKDQEEDSWEHEQ